MSSDERSEDNCPTVTVTMTYEMPVPPEASKDEALGAAESEFSRFTETDNASVEFEFNDPNTKSASGHQTEPQSYVCESCAFSGPEHHFDRIGESLVCTSCGGHSVRADQDREEA